MKQPWIAIMIATAVMILPLHAADQKEMEAASSVMTAITTAVKGGKGPALKSYFEKKIMVSEMGGCARMLKAETDYDGFSRNSGLLHAVFFDTMQMRRALRPYANTDELYCLRDVLSRGEVAQVPVNPDEGVYQICALYRERTYSINLRKESGGFKIIIVGFSQRKK